MMLQAKIDRYDDMKNKSKSMDKLMRKYYNNIIDIFMDNEEDTLDYVALNYTGADEVVLPDVVVKEDRLFDAVMEYSNGTSLIDGGIALFMLDSFQCNETLTREELYQLNQCGLDGVIYVGCLDKVILYVSFVDFAEIWYSEGTYFETDVYNTEIYVDDVFRLPDDSLGVIEKASNDWWLYRFSESQGLSHSEYFKSMEAKGLPQKLGSLVCTTDKNGVESNLTGLAEQYGLKVEKNLSLINSGHSIECMIKMQGSGTCSVVIEIVDNLQDCDKLGDRCVVYRMPGIAQVVFVVLEERVCITFNTITGKFDHIYGGYLNLGISGIRWDMENIFKDTLN